MKKPKPVSVRSMNNLGKLIESEEGNDFFELNQKQADSLLDAGYVKEDRWIETIPNGSVSCSQFITTELGREEYWKWMEEVWPKL